MFGLMTVKAHRAAMQAVSGSHDHWRGEAKDWEEKFKQAIKDLAERSDQINQLRADHAARKGEAIRATDECTRLRATVKSLEQGMANQGDTIAKMAACIAALRPDAEWARARKAKAAEYEANRRVRKAKGAG